MRKRLKSPKGKGSYFENRVKEWLESSGFFVTRRAASLFPDLIVIGKYGKWAIECKSKRKYITKKEKEDLRTMRDEWNFQIMLAYPKYGVYSKKSDNIKLEEIT